MILAVAVLAFAPVTVDAWLDVSVPMKHLQGDDVCLRKHTMIASFGIPVANVMEDLVTPQLAWTQATGEYTDLNAVTAGAGADLVARYIADGIDEATGVWSYSMELDVRALAAHNGDSLLGRADTVVRTKLFLVALAENMSALSGGKFKLRVKLTGLPSQTDLPGTRLYATTTYPYSAGSPLLAAYRAEMIDASGMCGG
jgi:hypothetical protein